MKPKKINKKNTNKSLSSKKELEKKFNLIFNNVNDAIYLHTLETKDIRGKFLDVNKKATEMLGYSKEEFLKMNPKKIDDPEKAKEILPKAAKEIKEKGKAIFEMIHIKKNGEKIPVELSSQVIDFEEKKAILTVARDISLRKKAEEKIIENENYLKKINDTMQTAMVVLDKEGKIKMINSYMEKISGYKLKDVKGKDWFSTFLPKVDFAKIKKIFKKSIGNIQTKGNINAIITKDEKKIFIEWFDSTLKDIKGNVIGILSIGQDVTEKKKSEEILKRKISELEKLNKMMVGRELKMIELKNKLEKK